MGTTADKLNKLKETKLAIKTAIVNKGVEVTDTDTFASYASKIDSIQTGGGDLDFSQLGYAYTPTFITEGYDIGKQAYSSYVKGASTWQESFPGIDFNKIEFFPKIEIDDTDPIYNNNNNYVGLQLPAIPNCIIFPDLNIHTINAYYDVFTNATALINCHIRNNIVVGNNTGFNGCASLKDLTIGGKIIAQYGYITRLFNDCKNLKVLDYDIVSSYGENSECFGDYVFANMGTIEEVKKLPITAEGNANSYWFSNTVIEKLVNIDYSTFSTFRHNFWNANSIEYCEEINISGLKTLTLSYLTRTASYLILKGLGTNENMTAANINILNWGYNSNTKLGITEAQSKQSLLDSLITYSFDRAGSGYKPCTLHMASYTKGILTEDEIAQITAKGFTIA